MKFQTAQDLFLIRTLKSLVCARISFADGLMDWASHLSGQPTGKKTRLLGELLARGKSLADALQECAYPASPTVVRLLDGLESNPNPDALLSALENQFLEEEEIRRKVREVILYPAFLLVLMSIVIAIYGLSLVETIFDLGWRHDRPFFYWWYSVLHPLHLLLLLLIPGVCLLAYCFVKDPLRLPLPGMGRIMLDGQRALLCQFLQCRVHGRRTISEALESARECFPAPYRLELNSASQILREGLPLEEESGRLITSQLRYYLNVCGTQEELVRALANLRSFYLEQVGIQSVSLQRSVELLALVFVGLLVGFVVIESFDFYYGYIINRFPF